ncbi:hypothetical protein [Deinococcus hopiensis]|uniref:Uncharacterized protein n=1 Tax=Deinococcus hopiensis KR-140 TaxID=695939 RepID=A0A1W1VLW0_9DEIO|nr:hypothetical protein [Deinococcus hopiensis]SMB94306.1 hypothetical protein SAMN00790413_02333 [Deinococcus hopiensis KR-140]
MPVRIRIYGHEATFAGGQWTCADDSLQAMLQALADPRATTPEQEHVHALYAAGRFGGLIATPQGWEAAPHPEAEIRMEDIAPTRRPEQSGWLSFLKRKR